MKLGLYGGSFNPVHYGHLILAEQARETLGLDEVWFIPARQPPHKPNAMLTSGKHRLEMLELALAGHERFTTNRLELDREGASYTVDTLQQLHEAQPDRELYFFIGGDSLRDLPGWRQPERIAQLATIVAVNRGREELSELEFPPDFQRNVMPRVRLVQMPAIDISSTDLRQRIREGRSIRFFTPRAVELYIREHGLYRE